jgi:hypothetical protein
MCPNSCSGYEINPPHKLLLAALNSIMIKCENFENGCSEKVKYKDLQQHLEGCVYSTCICPNYGCNKEMLLKDFTTHK